MALCGFAASCKKYLSALVNKDEDSVLQIDEVCRTSANAYCLEKKEYIKNLNKWVDEVAG